MLNKVRNTAARKLIQGKRENDAFFRSPPPPSFSRWLARLRCLAPRPLSMQIYSRDKGTKMAINLTKNRDSLLKTWKNVFDDTPDVNWWDLWLSHTFLFFHFKIIFPPLLLGLYLVTMGRRMISKLWRLEVRKWTFSRKSLPSFPFWDNFLI